MSLFDNNINTIKICSKCKEEKNISEFGRYDQCQKCVTTRQYEYNEKNKERLKEYYKRYRKINKDKRKEYGNCINIICIQCGKPGKAQKQNTGKFCSDKCSRDYHIGEKAPGWKGGVSYGKYCPKFNKEFKNRVRAFFNYECVLCGKNESKNLSKDKNGNLYSVNLSVHHIYYNKRACCDNTPLQFVPLCIRCHIKTNHNRERWESMLHTIIDYMYNGKSYYTRDEFINNS